MWHLTAMCFKKFLLHKASFHTLKYSDLEFWPLPYLQHTARYEKCQCWKSPLTITVSVESLCHRVTDPEKMALILLANKILSKHIDSRHQQNSDCRAISPTFRHCNPLGSILDFQVSGNLGVLRTTAHPSICNTKNIKSLIRANLNHSPQSIHQKLAV